jgi:hypothetical protein
MQQPVGIDVSPKGRPWLLWQDIENGAAKGRALDADNTWWIYYGPADIRGNPPWVMMGTAGPGSLPSPVAVATLQNGTVYHPTSPLLGFPMYWDRGHWFWTDTGTTDWISDAADWLGQTVATKVVPAFLGALTIANPAVGSVATIVYQQAMQVAQGKSMTSAVTDAIRGSIESQLGPAALTQYDNGYASTLAGDAAKIQKAFQDVQSLGDKDLMTAFRVGTAAATAKRVQDNAWDALVNTVTSKAATKPQADALTVTMRNAQANGADLRTVAIAFLGPQAGIDATHQALLTGGHKAGVPATVMQQTFSTNTPAASSSDSGFPWGWIGLFGALGAGWWWWKGYHR